MEPLQLFLTRLNLPLITSGCTINIYCTYCSKANLYYKQMKQI